MSFVLDRLTSGTVLRIHEFNSDRVCNANVWSATTNNPIFGGAAYVLAADVTMRGARCNVALKVFPKMLSDVERELLSREMRACSAFNHRYILPFIGTSMNGMHSILVSPWAENGNLKEFLQRNPDADRPKLVLQVAEAMKYLHETAGYVHGDIKCENVLISDAGDALLTDFGLSTTIEKAESEPVTVTAIRQRSTFRFSAPELVFGDADSEFDDDEANQRSRGPRPRSKTPATDVYAFGMLMLQVFSGAVPWHDCKQREIYIRVMQGIMPTLPKTAHPTFTNDYRQLCRECWAFDPADRPTMVVVRHKLFLARDALLQAPPPTKDKSPFTETDDVPAIRHAFQRTVIAKNSSSKEESSEVFPLSEDSSDEDSTLVPTLAPTPVAALSRLQSPSSPWSTAKCRPRRWTLMALA